MFSSDCPNFCCMVNGSSFAETWDFSFYQNFPLGATCSSFVLWHASKSHLQNFLFCWLIEQYDRNEIDPTRKWKTLGYYLSSLPWEATRLYTPPLPWPFLQCIGVASSRNARTVSRTRLAYRFRHRFEMRLFFAENKHDGRSFVWRILTED